MSEKDEDQSLERLLELVDEQVKARGAAERKEMAASERIAELASEARRKGASMPQLAQHVKRLDKRDGKLKPISRQALDTMLAVHEGRREARTTRASRRRRDPVEMRSSGGGINLDALR